MASSIRSFLRFLLRLRSFCVANEIKSEAVLIDDAIIGPQRLVEVVNSNDTLKELTLFVTEIDSRKYSRSFTGKSCNSTNSIERSARVHKTPMSLLEEAAQKKQIKLELIDPHTYDTLKGLICTRSRNSHPCT